eukprot:305677-Chlamydomonas_euryale.AAC.3
MTKTAAWWQMLDWTAAKPAHTHGPAPVGPLGACRPACPPRICTCASKRAVPILTLSTITSRTWLGRDVWLCMQSTQGVGCLAVHGGHMRRGMSGCACIAREVWDVWMCMQRTQGGGCLDGHTANMRCSHAGQEEPLAG